MKHLKPSYRVILKYTLLGPLICYLTYFLATRINQLVFSEAQGPYLFIESLGVYALILPIFILSKSHSLFSLFSFTLCLVGIAANNLKMRTLATPIDPSDFHLLNELLNIANGKQKLILTVITALLAYLALRKIKFRTSNFLCAFIWILLLTTAVYQGATYQKFWQNFLGNNLLTPQTAYKYQGFALNLLYASAANVQQTRDYPKFDEIQNIIDEDAILAKSTNTHSLADKEQLDIYYIAAESLNFEENQKNELSPYHQGSGSPYLYVSRLGGGTANSELEALCGIQAQYNEIYFVKGVNSSLPCLPQLLHNQGFNSFAFHANDKAFYNRENTYKQMGFQKFYSQRDYTPKRLQKNMPLFLPDKVFFKKSTEFISEIRAKSKKNFFHLMTLSLHYPFESADIEIRKKQKDLSPQENYTIARGESIQAIFNFTEAIKKSKRNSLIFIFGDHQPTYGTERFTISNDLSRHTIPAMILYKNAEQNNFTPIALKSAHLSSLFYVVDEALKLESPQRSQHSLYELSQNYLVFPENKIVDLRTKDSCYLKQSNRACESILKLESNAHKITDDIFFGKNYFCQLRSCNGSNRRATAQAD
ncbi:MAG: sulfatase-like hydrolase/transferase [Bdellovibrionota bacterium]